MGTFLQNSIVLKIGKLLIEKRYLNKQNILIGFVASSICIIIVCVLTERQGLLTGVYGETYHNVYITIPTFTLFCSVRYWLEDKRFKPKIKKFLQSLGG